MREREDKEGMSGGFALRGARIVLWRENNSVS